VRTRGILSNSGLQQHRLQYTYVASTVRPMASFDVGC
jgi:hypothetical protein